MSSSCRILSTRLLLQLLRGRGASSAWRGNCQWTHVGCKEEKYPPLTQYQKNPSPSTMAVVKVRGLPWTCTVDDLIGFFYDCKIRNREEGIHLPLNREGRPRGDAVIEFESEEDVQKAMEKNRKYMGQRYIEGLSIAEDGITFVLDHRGKKSGDAFVQFMTAEMADRALLKHKEEMGNRYIEIFKSRRDEIQSLRFPYRRRKKDATFSPTVKEDPVEPLTDSTESAQDLNSFSDHYKEYLKEITEKPLDNPELGSTSYVPTIHMRGLPFQASAEDIANFFHPLTPMRITMDYNSYGKSTGEAMVQFATQEDAVCGMVKNRSLIQNRFIELFLGASPKGH
ncbi:G-rich sequence factor 1 isoform X2 [Pleurodeles waltl]|uniref:G-rich sequence factor 1 isoform X2 n=1 Tax=Pleurodeles waltl TaxID=8319 RepID=UPI003709BAA2